jgi:hypothetical protein
MTFIILPSVYGPTGILIGAPVSLTYCPLTKPSVESMAIVLTLESPNAERLQELICFQLLELQEH